MLFSPKKGTFKISRNVSSNDFGVVYDGDLIYRAQYVDTEGSNDLRPSESVCNSLLSTLQELILEDFGVDATKLQLVSDIPVNELIEIKSRWRTGTLYDSFGRALFQ